jgi:hypothetical protein
MPSIRRMLRKVLGRTPSTAADWVYPLPAQRALYFAVPKVACTTWLRICCTAQGVDLDRVDRAQWFDAIPHVGTGQLARFAGWFRFGFVRNPWDRLVSCYLNKILPEPGIPMPTFVDGIPATFHRYGLFRAGMSFGDFARAVASIPDDDADDHFRSQHRFFEHRGRPLAIDLLARFEDAPAAFDEVIARLGLPIAAVPHAKRTPDRRPCADYYRGDPALVELVGQRYARDVERFGYRFDVGT